MKITLQIIISSIKNSSSWKKKKLPTLVKHLNQRSVRKLLFTNYLLQHFHIDEVFHYCNMCDILLISLIFYLEFSISMKKEFGFYSILRAY